MLNEIQSEFDSSIRKMAFSNLIKKLKKQGIQKEDISDEKFTELLEMENLMVKKLVLVLV